MRLFCNICVTFFRCAAKVTTAQNKRRTCYCATPSSKVYIHVHFWLTSFLRNKKLVSVWNQQHPCCFWIDILVNFWTRVSAQYRHGGRADRSETMFHKNLFLWNSQGNLQHGCCKLPKHRCCVEPPPSVAVLKCTWMYIWLRWHPWQHWNVHPCTFVTASFFSTQFLDSFLRVIWL